MITTINKGILVNQNYPFLFGNKINTLIGIQRILILIIIIQVNNLF